MKSLRSLSALILVIALAGCVSDGQGSAAGEADQGIAAADRSVEVRRAPAGTLAYIVDGDVFVAHPDGSQVVKIADGSSDCNGKADGGGEYWNEGSMWSPDGRYLAYRYADCFPSEKEARAAGLPEGVVISDAQGNVLTSFPADGWDIGWSPDSTRIAVWDEFRTTIGIYGIDGIRQMQITREFPGDCDCDPFWMPDGAALVLSTGNNYRLIPLDGDTLQKPPAKYLDTHGDGIGVSPDGSSIATIEDGSLTIARSDGSDAREVPGDWVANAWSDVGVAEPAWSPAGDRIAVVSAVGGGGRELRVVDVATGSATLVTHAEPGMEMEVVGFTPKGDRILFTTGDRSLFRTEWATAWSLRSIGVDGSGPRLIVEGTSGNFSRAP